MNRKNEFVVGIDIGNTRSRLMLITARGEILHREILTLSTGDGYGKVLEVLKSRLSSVMEQFQLARSSLAGVGVGFGGPVDFENGSVISCPGADEWDGLPLKSDYAADFGVPVVLENDANAAAWGEYVYRYQNIHKNVVYITISSGVGAGFIINGHLHRGCSGIAGEIGHIEMVPDGPICSCGKRGCLESLVSGFSIARGARQFIMDNPTGHSPIWDIAGDLNTITAETVFLAAEQKDNHAIDTFHKVGHSLGLGLRTVILTLAPDLVILGGGVMRAEKYFMPIAIQTIEDVIHDRHLNTKFVYAVLGDYSVAYGAARLCARAINDEDTQ